MIDPNASNIHDVSRWEMRANDALGVMSWQPTHVGGGLGTRVEASLLAKLAHCGPTSASETFGLTAFNVGTIDWNDFKPLS